MVAADLLAQSEHDVNAKGILLTTDEAFGKSVIEAVEEELKILDTAKIARQSWDTFGEIGVVDSLDEAVQYANEYAPEHLEINVEDPDALIPKLVNYGSLFIGQNTEPLDKTETGRHGILYGEIDPESGQVTTLDFIPMAKLRYIPLIVRVTPDTTNTELYLKIAHEIEQRGNDNIFRFKVQGMRDPDISFDLDALKLRFRIADIIDETEPQYDFSALFAEHPSDMIGFYIQALKKPDMSPVEKKALFYGIHALLLTTDERS